MAVEEEGIEMVALESLGKGFDLASDFRLRFAKGIREGRGSSSSRKRLVVLDEQNKRDILIPGAGGVTIKGVSENIRCDKGDLLRFKSDVLEFNQMSELLNQKSAVQGKIPSGYFNALFDLSGDWFRDAADTKYLAFDGYFISLYYLHLTASPIVLQEEVKKSVPAQWDPAALSRFIQTYGTHLIVGMAVGGQDVICVKQKHSSKIPPGDLRRHLEDLGDFLFSDVRSPPLLQRKAADGKQKVPEVFNRVMQSNTMSFTSISETSSKDGLTIICSKRGGDMLKHSHSSWLQTVPSNPEAILFKFVPISSLLAGIPGSGYLSHAINLYLRYKPPAEDLQYFLEFQIPRQWAPMFCELPLRHHQRRKSSSPSLQFNFLGPKLHVSSTQVLSEQKPVVGLRLYLEGRKCDRLALHIHHLSSLPNKMILSSETSTPSMWRGSDDNESSNQFLEPVRWKRFSNVCTAVVKHDPNWLNSSTGVYIVTGAQLVSRCSWPKNVLHLRLLFTNIPNCSIRKTEWAAAPEASRKSSFLTNLSTTFSFTQQSATSGPPKQAPAMLNSGIYPDGPPVPVRAGKLLKYVEAAEVVRGPHDTPGHWLVTAAKLVTEGGGLIKMSSFAERKPHAVLTPSPLQGHINPLFQLAKLLHLRGFHITFVHTEYNHKRLIKSRGPNALDGLPDFVFETIPDGLEDGDGEVSQDLYSLCDSIRNKCHLPFQDLLAKLHRSASAGLVPPVTCLVSDLLMTFTIQAAQQLQLPILLLCPASASTFMSFLHFQTLLDKGVIPLKDESYLTNGYLDTKVDWIPGMQNFRLKDLPDFIRTTDPNDIMLEFMVEVADRAKRASAIVFNTFNELERDVLSALSTMLPSLYPIGPFPSFLNQAPQNQLASLGSNLWKEDTKCLQWLESKEPGSVVYVNFGSITVMSPEQLLEFAWGLANGKKPFLWIIRPDLVADGSAILSPKFVDETSNRGLIASWCPQEKVLNHPSVGGFLTHCGWNSTIESICAGVPMLCWPFFSDQPTNCKWICNEWDIGMEIDTNVKREEVEKLITELMVEEKGKKMKQKAMELKKKAEEDTRPGGCSYLNLDIVIKEVLLKQ